MLIISILSSHGQVDKHTRTSGWGGGGRKPVRAVGNYDRKQKHNVMALYTVQVLNIFMGLSICMIMEYPYSTYCNIIHLISDML